MNQLPVYECLMCGEVLDHPGFCSSRCEANFYEKYEDEEIDISSSEEAYVFNLENPE